MLKRKILIALLLFFSIPVLAFQLQPGKFINTRDANPYGRSFFYQSSDMRLVDNGRKMFIGASGASDPKNPFKMYYCSLDDMQAKDIVVPLKEYFESNPEHLLKRVSLVGSWNDKSYRYVYKSLLHYDEERGSAGLILSNRWRDPVTEETTVRYIYVLWDLKNRKISKSAVVIDGINDYIGKINPAEKKGQKFLNNVVYDIAYNRSSDKVYFCIASETGAFNGGKAVIDEKRTYRIMEVSEGVITEIASFREAGRHVPKMFYDALTKTILSVKYTETGKNGTANLIDLDSKTIKQIETPLLTYSAVFDPDKTRLYLLSNKTGNISVINRQTGRLMHQFAAGSIGFRIGFVQKDMLAFFNAQGVKIFSTKDNYKLAAYITPDKYTGGTKPGSWPQGGVIENGSIYIGWEKYIFSVKYK